MSKAPRHAIEHAQWKVIEAAKARFKNTEKRWGLPDTSDRGVVHYREEPGHSVEFDLHEAVENLIKVEKTGAG